MYQCHLCSLNTKQLNGLMSRHWKKHCNGTYSAEQYKIDVLANNGRLQKCCKSCSTPTLIPKGEAEYPEHCRSCYDSKLRSQKGSVNKNWKGGLQSVKCKNCNQTRGVYNYKINKNIFCSISCSTQFYNMPENQSEAKKQAIEIQKETLRQLVKDPEFKRKRTESMLKNQALSSSSAENNFLNKIKEKYPDAVSGHQIGFYSVDVWIPSMSSAIDFHGNYWHNMQNVRAVDDRKKTFLINNHKDIKYFSIWESEVKDGWLNYEKQFDVYILCGASGAGKSWIGVELKEQYSIIDYDKEPNIDSVINKATQAAQNPKLIITPIRATYIARKIREAGCRVAVVALIESEDTISERLKIRGGKMTTGIQNRIKRYENIKNKISMFWGNQVEVLDYLKNCST